VKTILKNKPRVVPVTDPQEIASIERNGKGDILGGCTTIEQLAAYWAYQFSLERWRKRYREELK
jgi:hypothetical protein